MSANREQGCEGFSSDTEPLRRYRVPKYRLALVREATISTTWDKRVREPRDVAAFLAPLARELDREHFWTLLLDGGHTLIGLHLVAIGSLTAAVIHPREVFKAAIAGNAAALVLVHYVPGHIMAVLWPHTLCGRWPHLRRRDGAGGSDWTHNLRSYRARPSPPTGQRGGRRCWSGTSFVR